MTILVATMNYLFRIYGDQYVYQSLLEQIHDDQHDHHRRPFQGA